MQERSNNGINLRLAFVGGSIDSAVGRTHVIASQMDRRFSLVSGCFSKNEKINAASAEEYGLSRERVYPSLESLLKNESGRIDAIAILTPQDQHFAQIMRCLREGMPVICEKSLVSSVDEASKVSEALSDSGLFLKVTYNYTGYPMVRELKEMICRGDLGTIQQIVTEMPQEGFLKKNEEGQPIMPQEWRLRDGIIPTISLDLGVHVHHLIQFLTGEQPLSVVAQHRSYGNFNGLTDDISVLAEYTNNVSAILWYSKAALGFRNGLKIRIFGDAGSAEWVQENPETIMYYKNKGQKLILDRGSNGVVVANQKRYTRFKVGHPAGYIEAFANYYYDLAHDLSHYIDHKKLPESKYTFGIRESIESMRFLEAVSRSARTRSWEPVS